MQRIASLALAVVMTAWVAGAQTTATRKKTATPARKPTATSHATPSRTTAGKAPAGKTTTGRTTGARTTASRTRTAPAPRTTWRNRQSVPSSDRYKEIQDALVAKGYLQSEDANGNWNPSSAEALKRFQSEQNLEPSGKINSLSLIALGLGPKRESAVVKPPAAPVAAQDLPDPGH